MKSEDDPVSDDESVLRLIHPVYYNADLALQVQPEAFRPRDIGETGLSVLRPACLNSPAYALLVVTEGKRHLYSIARIAVADLHRLHLTVRPDRIEPVPGHAIIPELNTGDYQQNRQFWKEVQKQLAELASRDIVHRPTPPQSPPLP